MIEVHACQHPRHRFPAKIIAEAVWMYFRFPLSFRMVEDMLAYRGITVSHNTTPEPPLAYERRYSVALGGQAAQNHWPLYSMVYA